MIDESFKMIEIPDMKRFSEWLNASLKSKLKLNRYAKLRMVITCHLPPRFSARLLLLKDGAVPTGHNSVHRKTYTNWPIRREYDGRVLHFP